MIEGIEGDGILVSKPRCEWDDCENTAVVSREVTFKVKGESVYRTRKLELCRPHDNRARVTGRFTLRDHPDHL